VVSKKASEYLAQSLMLQFFSFNPSYGTSAYESCAKKPSHVIGCRILRCRPLLPLSCIVNTRHNLRLPQGSLYSYPLLSSHHLCIIPITKVHLRSRCGSFGTFLEGHSCSLAVIDGRQAHNNASHHRIKQPCCACCFWNYYPCGRYLV